MMSRENRFALAAFPLMAAGACAAHRAAASHQRTRAFVNGCILTMDPDHRVARAVAVKNGTIQAVGSDREILNQCRKSARIVDLRGKTLIPGIVDAHSHFPGTGLHAVAADLNSPPIGARHNIAEIQSALRKRAASRPRGKWVMGFGYDDTTLRDARHPTRHDLDQVSASHPVVAVHISFHVAAVNSVALKILGFDEHTPDPEGGVIRREPGSRRPDGVLEETAAQAAYGRAMGFSINDLYAINRRGARDYAAAGVTTAQVGLAQKRMILPLAAASRLGATPMRLMVWPDADSADAILSGKLHSRFLNTHMFHIGAVKLFADGSIQAGTGYLGEPYHKPFNGDPDYRGYPIQSREKLTELVVKYHSAGMQIAVHGNGDAAIDDIIAAVREAQARCPRPDPRHILIHAQMSRADQLDAMKDLGITPSFHAVHPYYWGDRHQALFLGPERAARISPLNTALQKGLRFSLHCDTPVVPMNAMHLIWCAVNRVSSSGRVIGQAEQISPMQALRAVTIDAAWQVFQENNRGSIEPGKSADFAILDRNPLDCPETIHQITVLETIVAGKTIFTARGSRSSQTTQSV